MVEQRPRQVGDCVCCGSAELEPGTLQGALGLHFRPDNIKFLTMKSGLAVRARVCRACGHIHLHVSPEELRKQLRG